MILDSICLKGKFQSIQTPVTITMISQFYNRKNVLNKGMFTNLYIYIQLSTFITEQLPRQLVPSVLYNK